MTFVVRPSPAPIWTAAQRAHLRATLRDAFGPAIAGADGWSLAVLSADGSPLYNDRDRSAVTAASTQKLIVATTALDELGANFRFHTELLARQGIANGALDGNLWLGGSGDPSLRYPSLQAGVDQLARAGLQRIVDGGIVVDASEIAPPEINPLWNPDDANEDFEAPVSGISIDEDTVEFHVFGQAAGQPALVTFVPKSSAVVFSGQVMTSNQSDDVIVAATETPNTFLVSGSIPPNVEEKFWVPVHAIAGYAGAVLQSMLATSRISTSVPAHAGVAPLDATVLWDHASAELGDLIAHMLYVSDNHYADQFLRTLGVLRAGRGDDATGLQVERAYLARRHVPIPGLHLVDGSGLAHDNRVAAITLATILWQAQVAADPSLQLYLRLPEGGRQGTLEEYDFTTAEGRVRAKSGHLAGVGALAGYVNTYHHGRIVFAFLIDGSPGDPDAAIVRAVDRLATL